MQLFFKSTFLLPLFILFSHLVQQYFQQPQPDFLFDVQNKQQEFFAHFSYELLNDLNFTALYSSLTTDNRVTLLKTTNTTYSLGFTYGL